MVVEYAEPLARGWNRMKKALFRPFDPRKWFVVGFTAFLAGLTEWQGGINSKWTQRVGGRGWEDFFHFPAAAREWLAQNPFWAALIFAGAVAVMVLSVLITWLSSRGTFMFLDNTAHDRSRVTAPWREYRTQGNSLFAWRLLLGAAGLAVFASYLCCCFLALFTAHENGRWGGGLHMNALVMALGFLGLAAAAGYVSVFINDFVSAIMIKRGVTSVPAARLFWNLFKAHPLPFLLYGLIVFCLKILVAVLVIVAGFVSCCIGFLVLAIPYLNSVILLPVSYTFRAFSLEFLAQFGADYDVFSASPATKMSGGRKKPPSRRK
jgi:hypothetical protein